MAKYRITPSSKTIVQSPISIGHKAEKGVEAIEFDLTAWVETYGSGTLTVIMRRWGDAIPYPIALEIDENNKATWTLSDTDTAKAGMAYAQLSYIVGDTVVKKSDIYTFRVMDSLTGEGEPPEAYESWLEHLTHLAAEAMAEVLDIEGIVTDKTLTIEGGIADAKAAGDALALKADKSTTYTKTEVDQMIEDVEVETDTTLAISGAPADAKKVGDELSDIKADLGDVRDVSYDLVNFTWKGSDAYPLGWRTGYWATTAEGAEISSVASNLYIRTPLSISIVGYPDMESAYMFSITPPNGYGVRVTEYDRTSRSTIKHYGNANITENPQFAGKAVFVPFNKSHAYVVTLGKFVNVDAGDYITAEFTSQIVLTAYLPRTNKKDRTGAFEFFTVNVERPLPFGGQDVTAETQEIECVLMLPTTYKKYGTPTRLVMACHGAGGYIKSSESKWYTDNWVSFMQVLIDAGYGVFDSNIFPNSTPTNVMGYALGSPLYVQVLKRAYDYIQENYNVYPQIFAHGTSMGGVGATAFSHIYPELVLAESSFAGRDVLRYLYALTLTPEPDAEEPLERDRVALAYGYSDYEELVSDHFSHVVGNSPSLSLIKYENGVAIIPPDRETNYDGWINYYSELATHERTDNVGTYIGHRKVPYKAWNSWADNPAYTKLETILQKAYNTGSSCPYYIVNYETGSHSAMSLGTINNMRAQLLAWYKRWE